MAEESPIEDELMSKHDFYFEAPLYEFLELVRLEKNLFYGDVDAYSAKNSSDTTYAIDIEGVDVWTNNYLESGYYLVKLTCKRKQNDILRFFIYKDRERTVKLGQYPSLADLQFSEIGKKYDKVLPTEDLKNLKKAIGLVAHGAGAGSFVYLRRIFENLIFETYENNADAIRVNDVEFKKHRMMDKVEILERFLPTQLVEMKSIYSILSKGVHELTEEECLKYFAPLKLSIELILDEKIDAIKKKEKDISVKKQLQDIHQELVQNEVTNVSPPPTSDTINPA